MKPLSVLITAALSAVSTLAFAKVDFKTIEYKHGSETFEGVLVTQPHKKSGGTSATMAPAILMIHNWMGISDETKAQATRMAELGYTVFAADIYGKGIRPKNPQEAGQLAGKFKSNRKLFRENLIAALETLKSQKGINTSKIIAVGYCFGGTGVLELARSGADIKGAVSFHGGLDSPAPEDGKNIKAKILALHGADDPFVKTEDLTAFEKEMRDHKVDWELVKFGGAVHSFTDKGAGSDNSKGAAYNANADVRSFKIFKVFAQDIHK